MNAGFDSLIDNLTEIRIITKLTPATFTHDSVLTVNL